MDIYARLSGQSPASRLTSCRIRAVERGDARGFCAEQDWEILMSTLLHQAVAVKGNWDIPLNFRLRQEALPQARVHQRAVEQMTDVFCATSRERNYAGSPDQSSRSAPRCALHSSSMSQSLSFGRRDRRTAGFAECNSGPSSDRGRMSVVKVVTPTNKKIHANNYSCKCDV